MVSVIICTYNRAESLRETLGSLQAMTMTDAIPWELIIIDNNSTDQTKQVAETVIHSSPIPMTYAFETHQGYSYARNRGIQEARGDIIAFVDDDTLVDAQWLFQLWQCYQHDHCDATGGRVVPLYPSDTPQWIREYQYLLRGPIVSYDYGEKIIPLNKTMDCFITANFSAKKSCFDDIGLFRTDLQRGEDEDWVGRLRNTQKQAYYNGKQLVWHKVPRTRMTYRYLAQWYFGAGRYMVQMYHAADGMPRWSWGVPKPHLKSLGKQCLLLVTHLWNRKKFLHDWEMIFRYIGICYEAMRSTRETHKESTYCGQREQG